MGRFTCFAVALSFAGCAKSRPADKSPVEPGASGSITTLTAPMQDKTTVEDTAAPAPLPPDDLTPKGGEVEKRPEAAAAANPDTKELGKSSAALGTTDHGELFDQLAVKVESAKLGAKASPELSTAVAGKTTELDTCYANARKGNAKLAGSIEIVFSVDAAGNISSVTVKSSTVKSKELEACVKDVAKLVKVDKSLISTKTTKATVVIAFGS
jgi:hypothetical protein